MSYRRYTSIGCAIPALLALIAVLAMAFGWIG